MTRSRLPLVFALVLVGAARADDWPVPRGASREPAPFRYDPAAWKQVRRDFLDDATACVLYAATTHLVDADSTVETIVHDVTRLNSRKAVEKSGLREAADMRLRKIGPMKRVAMSPLGAPGAEFIVTLLGG